MIGTDNPVDRLVLIEAAAVMKKNPDLSLEQAKRKIWADNPTYAEMSRRVAKIQRDEAKAPATKPGTLAEKIERAIGRAAIVRQAEPGQFSKSLEMLRTEIRRTEIGRQLMALARSPQGSKPAGEFSKAVVGDDQAAADEWLEKWAPR